MSGRDTGTRTLESVLAPSTKPVLYTWLYHTKGRVVVEILEHVPNRKREKEDGGSDVIRSILG